VKSADKAHTILTAIATPPALLELEWSNGIHATLNLAEHLR
jgi:hypothetical protein